jgi:hypothetical protein
MLCTSKPDWAPEFGPETETHDEIGGEDRSHIDESHGEAPKRLPHSGEPGCGKAA